MVAFIFCAILLRKKRVETILREQKEFLGALIDSSPVAMVTTDLDQTVLSCNPAFESMFEYSGDEVKGQIIDKLLRGQAGELDDPGIMDQAQRSERRKTLTQLSRKNGSVLDVEITVVPLTVVGQRAGGCGSTTILPNTSKRVEPPSRLTGPRANFSPTSVTRSAHP